MTVAAKTSSIAANRAERPLPPATGCPSLVLRIIERH
jgi:hypothetical protein